jgi:predicted RNase H-like nuclease (RuvC/YqgF family)
LINSNTGLSRIEGKSESVKNLLTGLKGTEELIMNFEGKIGKLEEANQKLKNENTQKDSEIERLVREHNEYKKSAKSSADKNTLLLKKTIEDQETEIRGLKTKLSQLSQNLDEKIKETEFAYNKSEDKSGSERLYDEIIFKLSNILRRKINLRRVPTNEKENLIRELLGQLENAQIQQRETDLDEPVKEDHSNTFAEKEQPSENVNVEDQLSEGKEYTRVTTHKQIEDDGGEVWIYKRRSLKIGDKNRSSSPIASLRHSYAPRSSRRSARFNYTSKSNLNQLNSELKRLHRDVRRMKDDYFTRPSYA